MRRLLLAFALAIVAIPAAVALAALPSATTNPASSIGTTSATLNASVNPGSENTTVYFDYGTSTSYNHTVTYQATINGSAAVSIPLAISGLTAGTTYHYQVRATNSTGSDPGGDRTFTTSAGTPPSVSTSSATNISRSAATLRGAVDPNSLATTYKFQYGTSSSKLTSSTGVTGVGSGNGGVNVAANIGGLSSNKRIYFRITASNSAGSKTGSTRSFVTAKSLSINEINVPRSRFGGSSRITGDLDGSGVNNQTVAVQGERWPFHTGFVNLASARSNSKGNFAVTVRGITANTHVRIVAAGNVTSVHNLFNGNRVGVKVRKGSRLRFSGVVTPQAPNGLVRIQKRKSNGKWGRVRRGTLKAYTNGRSRYALSTRRSKGLYRVQVVPRDGGAHAAGYSRKIRVR